MKKLLLSIAICSSLISSAQSLENKIPKNAQAVISINGDRLLDLVSVAEFNNYTFVQKVFQNISKNQESAIKSIEEVGFDINSKAYYFYQTTDSISYHNFIVKLTDRNKFKNLLSESQQEQIENKGTISLVKDYQSVTLWNDNKLLFSFGDKSSSYFDQHEERFKSNDENEYYYETTRKIAQGWTMEHAMEVFNSKNIQSILTNTSYLASKDNKAVASAWINNYGEILSGAMGNLYGLSTVAASTMGPQGNMYGIEGIRANMYFDKDAARMEMEMEIGEKFQKSFKKIYNSKIDKHFFKYFNQKEALMYISLSSDTESLLKEYPSMMADIYGTMMPRYQEETVIVAELISLILDEEAIADLITGDLLFILNDLGEKEVEYTYYDYDSDYNKIEKTETKKEISPDFTMMLGSEKEELLNKLARLGLKYQVVEYYDLNYYKIDLHNEVPFNLYTTVKNGIVFLTSSEENIKNIVNNSVTTDLGGHKKMITSNMAMFYVNGKELLKKVPVEELRNDELRYYHFAQENFTDAYFRTAHIKGNKILSEIKINAPEKDGNSFKFLLNFMDVLAR